MTKKNKSPLGIFTESVGLYFSNFKQFVKYMTFPVLGQIAGLLIIFAMIYVYSLIMPSLIEKYSVFDNFNVLVLTAVILTLPGMVIFLKAFWEYLVAYGAVNSMLENMLKSGKVYDFDAHTELIKRRSASFIGLWLLFGIFYALAPIPVFWIPAGVCAVYFVLIFQVFTYEPEQSPVGCLKKSFQLIKGHFASTFMLIALAGALTYVFIPQSIGTLFEWTGITKTVAGWIVPFVNQMPVDEFNDLISYLYLKPVKVEEIALFAVSVTIAQIFIQYTLPLRSLLWGMWYRELNGSLPQQVKGKKSSKSKKPSEVLMEESHKNFGDENSQKKVKKVKVKKLDRNILRRAMEKDDES